LKAGVGLGVGVGGVGEGVALRACRACRCLLRCAALAREVGATSSTTTAVSDTSQSMIDLDIAIVLLPGECVIAGNR
jgi:hypothetical protein